MRYRRAVHINAEMGSVAVAPVACLGDMQKLVGGLIEMVTELPNGDEVWANEEALFINGLRSFTLDVPGRHALWLYGNAYVIGRCDDDGESTDALSTAESVRQAVQFDDA